MLTNASAHVSNQRNHYDHLHHTCMRTSRQKRSRFRSHAFFLGGGVGGGGLHTYLSSYHTINPHVFSFGHQLITLPDQAMKSFHTVSLPITCSHRITYWFPVNHKIYLPHISARGVKVRHRGYGEYESYSDGSIRCWMSCPQCHLP